MRIQHVRQILFTGTSLGLSRREFAKKLKVDPRVLSRMEEFSARGPDRDRDVPTLATAAKLADFLGVPLDVMVTRQDVRSSCPGTAPCKRLRIAPRITRHMIEAVQQT
jgi:transcriptional regulator with XRE-family HTH domain